MIRALVLIAAAATTTTVAPEEHPAGYLTVRHACYQPAPLSWGPPTQMDTNEDTRLLAFKTSEGVNPLAVEVDPGAVCVIWSGAVLGQGA